MASEKHPTAIWLRAYCNENLGDDLFIQLITQRYPKCRFYLVSNAPNRQLQKLPNLTILPETLPQKVVRRLNPSATPYARRIRSCQAVVLIGGSMFIQQDNWQNKLSELTGLVKNARRFCIMGSNFGPYSSAQYLAGYHALFSKMNDCCFRDERTHTLFSDLGNVRWAPDIAFTAALEKMPGKTQRSMCISVVHLRRKPVLAQFYDTYVQTLQQIICRLTANGWNIRLLSFCAEQGDLECCENICAGMENPPEILAYSGNLEEMLDAIASSEYVLATRFHSMILGWLFGCRVFSLVYDEKMQNVLQDMHLEGSARSVQAIAELTAEEVLHRAETLPDREKVSARAQEQFAYLDKLLQGGHA